jgi:hypothetical protein
MRENQKGGALLEIAERDNKVHQSAQRALESERGPS